MRVVGQLAVVAVLAGAGFGGWYYFKSGAPGTAGAARAPAPAPIVEVASPQTDTVIERIEAVGTARANESIVIAAKQTGNIAKINFQEGQSVKAGMVLIELESRERAADTEGARAEISQARAAADDIRQQLDRARALRSSGNAPEARVDQLETMLRAAEGRIRQSESRLRAADARFDEYRISAPFDGKVGLRQVSLGALVQPGTQITTLDDVRTIKIDFSVPEQYLGQLKTGLSVIAVTPAYPGREFSGEVVAIDTRIDPTTRAVRLNAAFDNADGNLKPGMFLTVALAIATRQNAIIVPEDALVAEGARQFLFVVVDGKAIRREVKLGMRMRGRVEIVSGIAVSDTLIVRGLQRVRNNLPVTARPFKPEA
ncbi:MAG: efflux RND transporter periplasmic adaptor subunit [Alphaproteobacteria bacterium]|nr:efflux RND transporter periplasmic adaptor subunit [Alphaproteobacteria bacterium]